ncbi:dTDP-4-dehydrorhamnose reductase [Tsukamurella soli]|uniref:dTDP-4-dehydrorhamnose reductase n=1 Tax=Tsukamurella soli TaxID=644556 RepID=A0ABP8JX76_9ACTN
MRIVITGAAGQVGRWLVCHAAERGIDTAGLGRTELDVTDPAAVAALELESDDVLVNCAAYTAVDAAESDVDGARALNGAAPGLLAARCGEVGARLVHISTDYVFGPAAVPRRPWEPGDPCAPTSVYGRTKLAGERAALAADPRTTVVRTAWVYTGASGTSDFVGTMRRLAGGGVDPRVVDDQVGSPTYASDLAAGLLDLADLLATEPDRPGGVVHAAGAGAVSWFEVARAVFDGVGAGAERVSPCTTAEFPRPAPRPAYSVLSPASWIDLGLRPLPEWRDALGRALAG